MGIRLMLPTLMWSILHLWYSSNSATEGIEESHREVTELQGELNEGSRELRGQIEEVQLKLQGDVDQGLEELSGEINKLRGKVQQVLAALTDARTDASVALALSRRSSAALHLLLSR
jgi:hypothetical protein